MFNSNPVVLQQPLIRRGLPELILDSNAMYYDVPNIGHRFADGATETVDDIVILNSYDPATFRSARPHRLTIQRLHRMLCGAI